MEKVIVYLNERNTTSVKNPECVTGNNVGELIVFNNLKDTLLVIKQLFSEEYCFLYDRVEYFQKVGDSLIVLGVKRGDFWGSPKMDTLAPKQKRTYAISNEKIERLFEDRKEASLIQFFFPFKVKGTKKKHKQDFFKILLGYNHTKNKIFQESYIVPEGKMKYKIPSDFYGENGE